MINRFGLSHLNGWDGNSIQIDNEQGFILSPQVGAGVKDDNNRFTGVLMGKVDDANENDDAVGLIGYSKGQRSIFLDAETGKAEFGTSTSSKIVIEPGSYDTETGTPNFKAEIRSGNYNDSSRDGAGLLIDFAIPMMKFGTGNFEVSPQGHITAKGGGTIAGWNIADKELYQGKVGMSSNNKNDDGTSNDKKIAFWAGRTSGSKNSAPFRVNFDGEIVAEAGTIGGWTLSNKTISANGITLDSNGSIKANNDKWSITSGGVANFKDINITGGGATFGTRFDVTGAAWNDFQNLTADTAVIGELWAETARIDKLIAKEIEAVEARIGKIEADYITADDLTVGNLKAGTVNGQSVSWKSIRAISYIGYNTNHAMSSDGVTPIKVMTSLTYNYRNIYVLAGASGEIVVG